MRSLISVCLLLLSGLFALACEPAVTEGCVVGSTSACSCADGEPGESVCGADGRAGYCSCDESATEADDDEKDDDQDDDSMSTSKDGGTKPKPDAGASNPRDSGTAQGSKDAGTGDPSDVLEPLRQACVDTINQYRATLKLTPLKRASKSEESCSDVGAKYDHDRKQAHGSAAMGALSCRSYGVAQNTCPDHPYGGAYGDRATAMKRCLKQMWDEGVPPEGVDKCIDDYFKGNTACFLAHGHYINMASATSKTVSCGFYDTSKVMWMNQDFR